MFVAYVCSIGPLNFGNPEF